MLIILIQIINMLKINLAVLLAVIALATCGNPYHKDLPLIPTLVTAWWPAPGSTETSPSGADKDALVKLLQTPINFIIFGDKDFGTFVSANRKAENTLFIEVKSTQLTESWYFKRAQELISKGQRASWKDKASPVLEYSRMFLLNRAMEKDKFDTDEFIWVDPNSFEDYAISKLLEKEHVDTLLEQFKHHMFILTTPKDQTVHNFPNYEKTYFETKFDTFVTGQLFGVKRDAVSTMNLIYQDLLRVVIQFDVNLWSQDTLLSLLADRCSFLVSYLSADQIKPPPSRLLPEESDIRFQEQKAELQELQWWIGVCELGVAIVGILLAVEIIRFLSYIKKRSKPKPVQKLRTQEAMQSSNQVGSQAPSTT